MSSDPADEIHLICIAKQPLPGRVKTRLSPEFTPYDACRLAAAALSDTLEVLQRTPAVARTLVLEGDPNSCQHPGIDVIRQAAGGLDRRIAAAFEAAWARAPVPMLLVGMDTPQITPGLLHAAAEQLTCCDRSAVLGPAADGGWWALGLTKPAPEALIGVPMSTALTGARQRERLIAAGLRVGDLPLLTDVDDPADVRAVAAQAPASRFARVARTCAVRL